ncbi:MAG: DoxX family protein [Gemmatimonadaceae bacterium]
MSNLTPKTFNRLLWTAQSAAALLFLFAGSMKFIMPADKMQQGPVIFSIAFLHFIGICECLGALGLILPSVSRIQTWLTPLAAAGLTIIMIGAATVTVIGMGVAPAIIPVVVGVLTTWIAYARTRVAPISEAPNRVLRTA